MRQKQLRRRRQNLGDLGFAWTPFLMIGLKALLWTGGALVAYKTIGKDLLGGTADIGAAVSNLMSSVKRNAVWIASTAVTGMAQKHTEKHKSLFSAAFLGMTGFTLYKMLSDPEQAKKEAAGKVATNEALLQYVIDYYPQSYAWIASQDALGKDGKKLFVENYKFVMLEEASKPELSPLKKFWRAWSGAVDVVTPKSQSTEQKQAMADRLFIGWLGPEATATLGIQAKFPEEEPVGMRWTTPKPKTKPTSEADLLVRDPLKYFTTSGASK